MANTYWKGDKAEYTGKVEVLHGGTFYELLMLEGHLKGQTKLTSHAPVVDEDQRDYQRACEQSAAHRERLATPEAIRYQLPNGAIVAVPYDVCKAASVITYTLKGGRIVDAVIVRGER